MAITLIFEVSAAEMEGHDFRLGCPIGVPAAEAPADSERIQAATAEVFNAWAAAYEAALVEAGMDTADARTFGRFIVATYEGTVTLARSTRSTQPYRDASAVLSSTITRSLPRPT